MTPQTSTSSSITLARLLKDPAYRAYFIRQPQLPPRLYHPLPFKVWGLKADGRWAGKAVSDFPEGFELVKRLLKSPKFVDVSISSRVIAFRAPEDIRLRYQAEGYDWCVMCRRPTHFVARRRHHALRDELHRYYSHHPVCTYCGIREETLLTPGAVTYGKN